MSHRQQIASSVRFGGAILRAALVAEMTGMSEPTIARLEHAGRFPRRIAAARGPGGWRSDQVEAWLLEQHYRTAG
jgi:predicted DNA-binding transcriptional regulator AlpA